MAFAYLNGAFFPLNDPKISLFLKKTQQGFFRTLCLEEGNILGWGYHRAKIEQEANFLKIKIVFPNVELIKHFVALNQAKIGLWRLKLIVIVIKNNTHLLMTLQKEVFKPKEIRLALLKKPYLESETKIKSLSYTKRLSLVKKAKALLFDDFIILNQKAQVLETAISNLLWERQGTFFYVSKKLPYYAGVSQSIALKVIKKLGFKIRAEISLLPPLLQTNLFICNSMKGILPVLSIEKTYLPFSKKLTEELQKSFFQLLKLKNLEI